MKKKRGDNKSFIKAIFVFCPPEKEDIFFSLSLSIKPNFFNIISYSTRYVGNYAHYEEEKRKNYEKALYDYEYQQKEIKRLREIYERFRFKPSKASLAMSRLHQLLTLVHML